MNLRKRLGHVIDVIRTQFFRTREAALLDAAARGDVEGISACLEGGAMIDFKSRYSGETALRNAVKAGSLEACSLLITAGLGAGIDVPDQRGNLPLHQAVQSGREDIVELLLAAGSYPNVMNLRHETPLHLAIEARSLRICRRLVGAGANVNLSGKSVTPLMLACESGEVEIARYLLKKGARADAVAHRMHPHQSVLHCAAEANNPDLIMLLVENGADPCVRNAHGKIPLEWAKFLHKHSSAAVLGGPAMERYASMCTKKIKDLLEREQFEQDREINARLAHSPAGWAAIEVGMQAGSHLPLGEALMPSVAQLVEAQRVQDALMERLRSGAPPSQGGLGA
jgi:hypothetical protein